MSVDWEALGNAFVPATGDAPRAQVGYWLLFQHSGLLVTTDMHELWLPMGPLPPSLADATGERIWVGSYYGRPCWAADVVASASVPAALHLEPVHGPDGSKLPRPLLALASIARQALDRERSHR